MYLVSKRKIRKTITGRWESCVFLLSALVQQGPRVAATNLELVSPHLQEGDGEPGFLTSIIARARRLRASIDRLVAADYKLFALESLLAKLRKQRDQGFLDGGAAIVRVRRFVQSQFEDPDVDALGLHSPRERRAEPLFRQAELIEKEFSSDTLEDHLGESVVEDGADPQKFAAKTVGSEVKKMRSTLDTLYETQRQHDEALVEKDRPRIWVPKVSLRPKPVLPRKTVF